MSLIRHPLLLSGLIGLLGCSLLAAIACWLVQSGTVSALLPYPLVTLVLGLILGGFSLAEIPIMVGIMRTLTLESRGNRTAVHALNALFVLFAAVYGAPILLLTGSRPWGLGLCGFGLLRLVSSLAFVPVAPP